jgi:hypothetical protein
LGAVCHAPSSNSTLLSFSSARQRQLAGEPADLQSTVTLSTILITKYANLAFVIASQPVRAEPPIAAVIDGSNWTFGNHGSPDQSINILDRLDLGLNNTHPPNTIPAVAVIINGINHL